MHAKLSVHLMCFKNAYTCIFLRLYRGHNGIWQEPDMSIAHVFEILAFEVLTLTSTFAHPGSGTLMNKKHHRFHEFGLLFNHLAIHFIFQPL